MRASEGETERLAQGCPPKPPCLVAGRSTVDNPKQERRNEARRRRRALKRARITFKGRRATIDCTVLNLSDLGACLKVESPIGIPDTFDLVLDNAPSAVAA